MEIKFDASGFEKDIEAAVKKMQEAGAAMNEGATKIIETLTDQIHHESIKRMPIDEGFLVASEKTKIEKAFLIKEISGHIYFPANSPASDYALPMHEHTYNLGKASQIKQAGQAEIVGRKFLERAWLENLTVIRAYIRMELKELLK